MWGFPIRFIVPRHTYTDPIKECSSCGAKCICPHTRFQADGEPGLDPDVELAGEALAALRAAAEREALQLGGSAGGLARGLPFML